MSRLAWLRLGLVGLVIVTLFAGLHNPYWVRGGDGDVYLCLARSLVRGEGYRFNGQPVAMVPIGWPLILAAAMKVSSSFALLKLLLISLITFGLLMWMCALRRLTSDAIAITAVLITAALQSTFQLTYWFHAEAMFIALTGSAMVLAFQIKECRRESWRIALLALLCGLSLTARWAGVLFFPIVAAALLDGPVRLKLDRVGSAVLASGAAVGIAFLVQRVTLRVDPSTIDPRYDSSLSGGYALMNEPTERDTLGDRLASTDQWFGRLLWAPLVGLPRWEIAVRVLGVSMAILTLAMVVLGTMSRQWVWLGLAGYCGALSLNWPHPIGRYFVPVAPLLLAGTMHVIWKASCWGSGERLRAAVAMSLNGVLAVVILAPNVWAYADDLRAMRSPDFASQYRGGTETSLIAAAQVLNEKGLRDGELVVSRRVATHLAENLANVWMRAAHLLTGRAVRTIPDSLTRDPDYTTFGWVSDTGSVWYLYQPRVYLQGHQRLTEFRAEPIGLERMEWRLFQVTDGRASRMELPANPDWPKRMPGLESP